MLKELIVVLLLSFIDIIISIDVICNINGGMGCCSLCTSSPCSMTFSSTVALLILLLRPF